MDETQVAKKLEVLGLGTKDAETYLALLKLGPSPVQKIAAETGLNRSSLYVVLDRLQKQGLVSVAGETGVRKYVSVAPERLERTAKERVEKARLTRQALESLVPEIEALVKHARHKPRVTVMPGVEGLRRAFEISLESREKKMRVFSHAGKIGRSLPGYLPQYVQERFRREIAMYGIHPGDEAGLEYVKHVPKGIDELIYLPEDKFRFPSDFAVFDDKVAFMSHETPVAVSIESKGIADVVKAVFDLARGQARRVGYDPHLKPHG